MKSRDEKIKEIKELELLPKVKEIQTKQARIKLIEGNLKTTESAIEAVKKDLSNNSADMAENNIKKTYFKQITEEQKAIRIFEDEIKTISAKIEKIKFDNLKEDLTSLLWDFDLNHQQQSIYERKALFSIENSLVTEKKALTESGSGYTFDEYLDFMDRQIEALVSTDKNSPLIAKLKTLINPIPRETKISPKENEEQKDTVSLKENNLEQDTNHEKTYQKLLKNLREIAGYERHENGSHTYNPAKQDEKLRGKLGESFLINLGFDFLDKIDEKIKTEQSKSSSVSSEEKSSDKATKDSAPSKSSIRFAIRQLEMVQLHLDSIREEEALSLENIEKTEQLIKVAYDRKIYNQNRTNAFLLNLLAFALIISLLATAVAVVVAAVPPTSGVSIPLFSALVAKVLPVIKAFWSGSALAKTGAILIPVVSAASVGVGSYASRVSAKHFSLAAAKTSCCFFASSLKEAAKIKPKAAKVPTVAPPRVISTAV